MKKHISISTIIMTIMLAGFLAAGCGNGDAPREVGEHGDEHAHEEGHGHEDEGHIELTPEALETYRPEDCGCGEEARRRRDKNHRGHRARQDPHSAREPPHTREGIDRERVPRG